MILIIVWAIIMTITLGILVVILLNLKKKHDQDIRRYERRHGPRVQDKSGRGNRREVRSRFAPRRRVSFPRVRARPAVASQDDRPQPPRRHPLPARRS